MKLTKTTKYYFMFWIIYIPLTALFGLLFRIEIEKYVAGLGVGAVLLFIFLTIRLIIIKNSEKKEISKNIEKEIVKEENKIEEVKTEIKNEIIQEKIDVKENNETELSAEDFKELIQEEVQADEEVQPN